MARQSGFDGCAEQEQDCGHGVSGRSSAQSSQGALEGFSFGELIVGQGDGRYAESESESSEVGWYFEPIVSEEPAGTASVQMPKRRRRPKVHLGPVMFGEIIARIGEDGCEVVQHGSEVLWRTYPPTAHRAPNRSRTCEDSFITKLDSCAPEVAALITGNLSDDDVFQLYPWSWAILAEYRKRTFIVCANHGDKWPACNHPHHQRARVSRYVKNMLEERRREKAYRLRWGISESSAIIREDEEDYFRQCRDIRRYNYELSDDEGDAYPKYDRVHLGETFICHERFAFDELHQVLPYEVAKTSQEYGIAVPQLFGGGQDKAFENLSSVSNMPTKIERIGMAQLLKARGSKRTPTTDVGIQQIKEPKFESLEVESNKVDNPDNFLDRLLAWDPIDLEPTAHSYENKIINLPGYGIVSLTQRLLSKLPDVNFNNTFNTGPDKEHVIEVNLGWGYGLTHIPSSGKGPVYNDIFTAELWSDKNIVLPTMETGIGYKTDIVSYGVPELYELTTKMPLPNPRELEAAFRTDKSLANHYYHGILHKSLRGDNHIMALVTMMLNIFALKHAEEVGHQYISLPSPDDIRHVILEVGAPDNRASVEMRTAEAMQQMNDRGGAYELVVPAPDATAYDVLYLIYLLGLVDNGIELKKGFMSNTRSYFNKFETQTVEYIKVIPCCATQVLTREILALVQNPFYPKSGRAEYILNSYITQMGLYDQAQIAKGFCLAILANNRVVKHENSLHGLPVPNHVNDLKLWSIHGTYKLEQPAASFELESPSVLCVSTQLVRAMLDDVVVDSIITHLDKIGSYLTHARVGELVRDYLTYKFRGAYNHILQAYIADVCQFSVDELNRAVNPNYNRMLTLAFIQMTTERVRPSSLLFFGIKSEHSLMRMIWDDKIRSQLARKEYFKVREAAVIEALYNYEDDFFQSRMPMIRIVAGAPRDERTLVNTNISVGHRNLNNVVGMPRIIYFGKKVSFADYNIRNSVAGTLASVRKHYRPQVDYNNVKYQFDDPAPKSDPSFFSPRAEVELPTYTRSAMIDQRTDSQHNQLGAVFEEILGERDERLASATIEMIEPLEYVSTENVEATSSSSSLGSSNLGKNEEVLPPVQQASRHSRDSSGASEHYTQEIIKYASLGLDRTETSLTNPIWSKLEEDVEVLKVSGDGRCGVRALQASFQAIGAIYSLDELIAITQNGKSDKSYWATEYTLAIVANQLGYNFGVICNYQRDSKNNQDSTVRKIIYISKLNPGNDRPDIFVTYRPGHFDGIKFPDGIAVNIKNLRVGRFIQEGSIPSSLLEARGRSPICGGGGNSQPMSKEGFVDSPHYPHRRISDRFAHLSDLKAPSLPKEDSAYYYQPYKLVELNTSTIKIGGASLRMWNVWELLGYKMAKGLQKRLCDDFNLPKEIIYSMISVNPSIEEMRYFVMLAGYDLGILVLQNGKIHETHFWEHRGNEVVPGGRPALWFVRTQADEHYNDEDPGEHAYKQIVFPRVEKVVGSQSFYSQQKMGRTYDHFARRIRGSVGNQPTVQLIARGPIVVPRMTQDQFKEAVMTQLKMVTQVVGPKTVSCSWSVLDSVLKPKEPGNEEDPNHEFITPWEILAAGFLAIGRPEDAIWVTREGKSVILAAIGWYPDDPTWISWECFALVAIERKAKMWVIRDDPEARKTSPTIIQIADKGTEHYLPLVFSAAYNQAPIFRNPTAIMNALQSIEELQKYCLNNHLPGRPDKRPEPPQGDGPNTPVDNTKSFGVGITLIALAALGGVAGTVVAIGLVTKYRRAIRNKIIGSTIYRYIRGQTDAEEIRTLITHDHNSDAESVRSYADSEYQRNLPSLHTVSLSSKVEPLAGLPITTPPGRTFNWGWDEEIREGVMLPAAGWDHFDEL